MIALTFDTDHLRPDELAHFLAEYPLPGKGTFFLWQPFPDVHCGNHETGIHPFLDDQTSWNEALDKAFDSFGCCDAVVRPHSCVYSHMLGIELGKRGVRAISQSTPLYQTNLQAFRHPWGIWELPIYYMDSMDVTYSNNWKGISHSSLNPDIFQRALDDPNHLYVFDFHPIHIALNTPSFEAYQSVKQKLMTRNGSAFDMALPGYGIREYYLQFMDAMQHNGIKSLSCSEVVDTIENQERGAK